MLARMSPVIDSSNLKLIEIENKRTYLDILKNEKVEKNLKLCLLKEITNLLNFYYLFSSDKVIAAIKNFIESPTQDNYIFVAQAMKKDLWKR